ncbi:MAG: conjugal transfer protein TraX [Clostridiales bacterium]|nr:conjugal transfer protein TraX [Clostridiales bacterium]
MTGFQIKLWAFVFMLLDHSAYLFPKVVPLWFRLIGRLSFPAYAYMIAGGCLKTHSMKKYILRLGLAAVVCEIPYDLLFSESISYIDHMNIIWTLLSGVFLIYILSMEIKPSVKYILASCVFGAMTLLPLDYGIYGICLILAYYFYRKKLLTVIFTSVIFTVQWAEYIFPIGFNSAMWLFSCFGWLLPMMYNGKKGKEPKHFFYGAYFLHLIIFLLIKTVL